LKVSDRFINLINLVCPQRSQIFNFSLNPSPTTRQVSNILF